MKYIILILVLLTGSGTRLHAAEKKINTYYPSPAGEYQEVQATNSLTIPEKDVNDDKTQVTAGEIWFETP